MSTTTHCQCWTLKARKTAQIVRITDHDQALILNGETFEPGLVLNRSAITLTTSLAPEPLDLEGHIDRPEITSNDLNSGSWDGATVVVHAVDWSTTDVIRTLFSGYMTDIEEQSGGFRIRLASIKSDLERTIGRDFGRLCDATLGDRRCGIDLSNAPQTTCDKRFATCRDTFANAENFRGFPHMPGNDAVISGPGEDARGQSREIDR